ncbi:MAG: GAF domain-containing protein, partial [Vicinamibacteria bacterium]
MSGPVAETSVRACDEVESLCREILERYEEVNLLYRLADSLAGVFSAKEICWRVLQEAAAITRARSGCVFLADAAGGGRIIAAEAGETARRMAERVDLVGCERATIIDGDSADRESLLSAPMSSGGGMVGQIVLEGRDEGAFTAGELKLVAAIGSLAGVFIENGRLVRSMQESERVRRELEIAREIQQS